MTIIQRSLRQAARYPIHQSLQIVSRPGRAGLTGLSIIRRSFNSSAHRCAEHSDVQVEAIVEKSFQDIWKEYKASYVAPHPTFEFKDQIPISYIGQDVTAVGFLQKVTVLSGSMAFAHVSGGATGARVQIILQGPELVQQLKDIRLNSPISVSGTVEVKHEPKGGAKKEQQTPEAGHTFIHQLEIKGTALSCLNSFPSDLNVSANHVFPPQSRHLQIRYDEELKSRLLFRSEVASYIRRELSDFHEIETPILFKSTPEGAREFLVPTRKPGYAYALPQSPQQYKQILMASGIHRYMQFARCFRDEDLRADRQPEFTQIDLEMAFTDGQGVMNRVEALIKSVYSHFATSGTYITNPLPNSSFLRMSYDEAMSRHGSDKPDLRITPLIYRIDEVVTPDLRGMLTSIRDPIIEACKFRLEGSSAEVQAFIRKFLDSPDAEAFSKNPDGPPGICVTDFRKPMEGLQIFGFEGAQQVKELLETSPRPRYQNKKTHKINTTFDEGDLLIIQARENLPHTGGSTVLGKLRLAIYKAALAEGLIKADPTHNYLWVTNFPMFTLDNGVDPGQGGTAGFSATHHPFTAPKTSEDVDLLLTDPLKAKADHYDLVVNGVELGGGSRRIHSAEMQKFVMRNILKMSEERMNDFSHLFEALRAGCPPHAGLAIGFDRMMAVLTGRESVKDVIAFPKSSKGEDMMVRSPSRMTNTELKSYHLQLAKSSSDQPPSTDAKLSPETVIEEIKTEPPSQA